MLSLSQDGLLGIAIALAVVFVVWLISFAIAYPKIVPKREPAPAIRQKTA